MKKSVKIYALTIFILFAAFTTIYYFSYKNISGKYNSQLKGNENNIQAETDGTKDVQRVNADDNIFISRRMTYISELYDSVNNTVTEAVESIPDEWIGLTRDELVQKLSGDNSGRSLVSFSQDRLVIRESRKPEEKDYSYYMVIEEGVLVVYYADMHDVFLNTYLRPDELPEKDREMLKNGFYISSVTELYDYLESITS